MTDDQIRWGNSWERTVIGHEPIDEDIYARELARYRWAATFIQPGMRVLELGCSSGFATRILPADMDYTGVDYSRAIIDYAREHFGSDRRVFVWSTIDKFLDGLGDQRFDVILAFEVLEHVKNGREVAQRLKQFAKTVLLTTPYREPVGFWGPHHVLHGLCEKDFPQFTYHYMHIAGQIASHPSNEIANLLVLEWHEGETYPDHRRVLCAIPTRSRYDSLASCLQAIAGQTVRPDKIVIYDETPAADHADLDHLPDHLDFRKHPQGRYLWPLLHALGCPVEVVWTPAKGQHIGHQLANMAGYDFVWRLDDDCVPRPDVLERLLTYMADDVGAVGGAVYEPDRLIPGGVSQITHFFDGGNFQWAPNQGVRDVDFLYSSFLYRAGIAHYKHQMSPVSFHEETIFTHRLKRKGYRIIADTSIHTYHFKAPRGGTREIDYEWAYAWDLAEFLTLMEKEWGIKVVALGSGIGDCFAFKHLIPQLTAKHATLVIGTAYPEVFADQPVVTVPYGAVKDAKIENVYDWCAERDWTGARGNLVQAYQEMYL